MSGTCCVYEGAALRRVAGDTLHPGGLDLTTRALTLAELEPSSNILDLGCGSGASAALCWYTFGLDSMGLDLSEALLAEAHTRHPGLRLCRATGVRLPFRESTLDAVLAECVLALMPDPDATFAEVQRVLRPAGSLIISDIYARIPEGIPLLRDMPINSCLRGALSRAGFEAILKRNGFRLALWEDHTPALTRMAASLILEYGSMDSFWQSTTGDSTSASVIPRALHRARPGYFLAIAERA